MSIHTCSYYCDRPACIRAQRDELRQKLEQAEKTVPSDYSNSHQREWVGLTHEELAWLNEALNLGGRFAVIEAIEAKLKEKNCSATNIS